MRGAVRNWLIRAGILTGVAALVTAGWVANSWVSPERVREQVIAHLYEQFDGIDVHVGSARMRILGGIAVTDLRLTRRGDPPDRPFLVVPAAVVYHDKEQLNRGRLVIRKVELEGPELRLDRDPDGTWNLSKVLRPSPADKPVPTFVATGATVTVTDGTPGGLPPLTLTEARFTLLNDPLPVLGVQAQAAARGYGPVTVRARLNRVTGQVAVGLEAPEFPLGETAAAAARRFAPAVAPHLVKLAATAAVRADLMYTPDATPAWRHDVRVEVRDGRFEHPDLPWPVEQLAVKVRSVDGRVKIEEATARIGEAHIRAVLETRENAVTDAKRDPDDPFARIEDHFQKLDVTATGLKLDDALFGRMGERGRNAKRMFSPSGAVDLTYKFAREAGGWKRETEVRPRRAAVTYERFRYPVTDVEGSVKRVTTHSGTDNIRVELTGRAGGQAVAASGNVYSGVQGQDPGVSLTISGKNLPLDEKLVAALPGKYPDVVRQFRATGRGDIKVEIRREPGAAAVVNKFTIDVRDGAVNYTQFPLPVEKVKGTIFVTTTTGDDRDELVLHGFTGEHRGANVWLSGSKRAVPGSADRRLVLHAGGNGCPVDDDLKAAAARLGLAGTWATFAPKGAITFAADVEILDRGSHTGRPEHEPAFNPAADLKLTFQFYGPTVTPTFFPYDVSELSGWLEFRHGRVDLAHFAGRHGESRLRLSAGEVRFYPDGSVWANLGGLEFKPLISDDTLLKALPGKLRSGVADLNLRGGADLTVKHLVVHTPPDPPGGPGLPPPEPLPIGPVSAGPPPHVVARGQVSPPPSPSPRTPQPPPQPDPVVYWDLELRLTGAALDAGLPWEDLFGAVACRGRYEGTHLGLVRGNAWLDHALIARQPVSGVQFQAQSAPQVPDPARPGEYLPVDVRFANLSGTLFDGRVGGEARVVLSEPTHYDVWLTAGGVQLEKVAKHYRLGSDADLKGIAQAQVHVFNRPDPKTGQWTTEGAGKVDVPAGRMYNLPIMLDLLKVLKGGAPDKTAFEEAHAQFRLRGDRVKVDQLDLIGKAICVGGSGELDTGGRYVKFEFYTLGSQILAHLNNTPVGDFSAFLSRNFFMKIKLTRENGDLKYRAEPVPAVTEPTKAVLERMRQGAARLMGK
jgi:hypothetical protein